MKYLKSYKIFENKEGKENNVTFDYIKELDSYKNGDFHQTIMDIGYNKFDYDTMEEGVTKVLGSQFYLPIMLGQYNYQVGNGGHAQYLGNGYASESTSGMQEHRDIDRHYNMMNLLKESELYKLDITKKVMIILKSFADEVQSDLDETDCHMCSGDGYEEDSCYECHGDGQVEDICLDCDGEGEIDEETCDSCGGDGEGTTECDECGGDGTVENTCDECGGSGVHEPNPDVSHLDDRYYKINDEFLKAVNEYSEKLLKTLEKRNNIFKKLNQ